MKKALSVFLSLLLCCSFVTFAFADEEDFDIDSNGLLYNYTGTDDKVVVPDGVKTLSEGVFYGATMSEVVLPDSLEVIEGYVFCECKNLKAITIPQNVKEIGDYAFDYCPSLASISVAAGNQHYQSVNGVLFSKPGDLLLRYPEAKTGDSYAVPDTVRTIAPDAFYGTKPVSVTMGDNVEEIKCYSFQNCENLTEIKIGKGVKLLGDWVFGGDKKLTRIDLPAALEEIGGFVFDNCTALKEINVAAGGKHFASADGVLYSADMKTVYKHPEGKDSANYTLPAAVKKVWTGAFTRCAFTEIDLSGVTLIDDFGLNECKQLKTVVLGAGLTKIGYGAFINDDGLTDVYYLGNSDTWKAIDIDKENTKLTDANLHYLGGADVPMPSRSGDIGDPWKPEDLPEAGNIIYSDDWGDDLPFTLDDKGTLTISGSGATYGYVTVEFQPGVWSPGMPLPTWSPLHAYAGQIKRVVLTNGLTVLGPNVFYQCNNITDVYFDGTEAEWNALDIREGNETLTGATIHFKYVEPPAPKEIEIQPLPADEQSPALDTRVYAMAAGCDGTDKTGDYLYASGQAYGYVSYFTLTTGDKGGDYTVTYTASDGAEDTYTFTAAPLAAYRLAYYYNFTPVPAAFTSGGGMTYTGPGGVTGAYEIPVVGGVISKGYLTVTLLRQGLPHEHDWGAPTYAWRADNASVTATRVCRGDDSHVETETVNTTGAVTPATCTVAGKTTYTATFTNPAFARQTKEVAIPAKGHNWGEATYTWSADNATVTAKRTCKTDPSHAETETVNTTKAVTAATCTEAGKTTYTATFTNPAFAKQTKEAAIPAAGHDWGEPTYTWSADNATVTAKRVCRSDESHAETETVNTTAAAGKDKTTYTAVFTNSAFAKQTKEAPIAVETRQAGDVDGNGKVESADARLALRASVKLEKEIAEGTAAFDAADVNKDGKVGSDDARYILRASVKLEDLNNLK